MLKSFFKNVAVLQAYFEDHLRVAASATNFNTGRNYHIWFVSFSPTFFRVFYYVQIYPEKKTE